MVGNGMKKLVIITFNVCILTCPNIWALNLVEINQPVREKLYDSRSCNDLYMEASALEKQSFSYAADEGNKTLIASVASTVFTPALYFIGYSALQDYKLEIEAKSTFSKIEAIRYRMAEKRCFEK